MTLLYDPAQAAADANLTQEQLAARSQVVAPPTPAAPTATVTTPTTTITPESLKPATIAPYGQPTAPPPPDVTNLYTIPPVTATPEQTKAQGITDSLQTLNDQLVGKSADQTAANETYGVNAAQKTITDLNSQLTGLKNDAAAIPLLLEKNASSQGIASPIIDKQRSSLLRDNAIQALTVSSLMSAAQGQLANAQSLADKAVSAKYDPIQAAIDSATKNLNIILNSPQYSIDEKNQANAQLSIQNQKQAQLDQQKANTADINKIALTAAANGADAVTLQKVTAAATPVEAQQIVQEQQQQKQVVTFAQQNKVASPFFTVNGTVYRTSDGKAYHNPDEFFADGGARDFSNAPHVAGTIGTANGSLTSQDTQIVTAGGRSLLVNKLTGATIKDLGAAYKDGGGSSSPTSVDKTKANQPGYDTTGKKYSVASAAQEIKDQWSNGYIQGNGKISSNDYKAAKAWWVQQGLTAATFDTQFSSLIDQSSKTWKNDYGYKGN